MPKKIESQMKSARKIMKRRKSALRTLANVSGSNDQQFENTMRHADEAFARFKNAYSQLAKK